MPTALIVEDEPEANKLLSLLVQLRGYRTESAFTGGEALEKVERHPPDVVLLDLMLPDTNGFDICRTIKARRETTLIPVIMVTARLAADNRAHSYQVGANEFVPKPYTPDQIFDALRAADSWRREIDHHGDHGDIAIDAHNEVGPFAGVARLWSLMLARTSWDESAIRQLGLALIAIGQDAIEWGRAHRDAPHVATIAYELHADEIDLTVRDHAGWLPQHPPDRNQRLAAWHDLGAFDTINDDPERCEVRLSKRFSPPANASS